MSDLEQLQIDVEQFLASDDGLKYAAVSSLRPRSAVEATAIQTKLNETLKGLTGRNGKAGLAIIVMMPEVDDAEQQLPGVVGMLKLQVRVVENIMINMGAGGTGESCEEVALRVAGLLQHRSFDGVRALMLDRRPVVPVPDEIPKGRVEYAVQVMTNFGVRAVPLVATPVLTAEAGVMTLTTTTSGAAIYYTLDGSYPGPGNAAALLYGGPVTVTVPGDYFLRAAAHKTGLAASGERRVEFEVA